PYAVLGIPTATYNPISHLDPHSPKFTVDCERIAEGLVSTPKKDHWEISALDAVAVIIKWVKLYGAENGFPVNLLTVRRLVQLPPERRLDFFQTMATCGNASLEERAGRYASDRPEVQDCFGTAQREMSFLYDEGIEKVFVGGKDEISFKDLKRRNDTYFLIIEPDALKERGKFLRLLVVSALGELYRETRKPEKPVLFMLDEFAQLGKLSFVEDAASIAREYQIKFWFILQNLTKLRDLYGKGADSILAAAGAVQGLAFTPNDMETANYFSERSGVKTVMKTAFTRSGGTSASNSGSSSSQGWSESRHEVKEPRYTVQELFELGENSQLLICPNVAQSLDLNRFPYFEGTRYTGLYEVDPYHMENGLRKAFEERARAGYFHVSLKAPIFTPPHIWPSELLFDPDDYKPPFVKCGACGALSSFWVWNQKDACPKCEKDIPPVGYCVEYPKA
ncbi:type IV secretory system conjugative DNA transfer family protein, partial [Methylomagnum sp.]